MAGYSRFPTFQFFFFFLFSHFVLPPISFYNTLKVVKDGISGEFSASRTIGGKLWSSQMVFLAKEGDRLCSVAAVKEYMERSPKYNFEDLINFKAFLREDGTTPGELREQIQRSVEVAPWGLKKYKSNQKPGARLPSAQKPDKILLESVKEDEWSEDDEEDEANIPYDADSDEEAKDEKNLGRKPKNDYEPFVYEMIPTKKAKELRMDLNMLTIARRPFKLILNETIERAKEDKNEDTLESCDRKRKFDLAQFYPELKIEYPRESELIKNVVRSKRQRSSRHIG